MEPDRRSIELIDEALGRKEQELLEV